MHNTRHACRACTTHHLPPSLQSCLSVVPLCAHARGIGWCWLLQTRLLEELQLLRDTTQISVEALSSVLRQTLTLPSELPDLDASAAPLHDDAFTRQLPKGLGSNGQWLMSALDLLLITRAASTVLPPASAAALPGCPDASRVLCVLRQPLGPRMPPSEAAAGGAGMAEPEESLLQVCRSHCAEGHGPPMGDRLQLLDQLIAAPFK